MPKKEMICLLAENLGTTKKIAKQILTAYEESLEQALLLYPSVKIGNMIIIDRVDKKGYERTLNGKKFIVPDHKVLKPRMVGEYKKYDNLKRW